MRDFSSTVALRVKVVADGECRKACPPSGNCEGDDDSFRPAHNKAAPAATDAADDDVLPKGTLASKLFRSDDRD